MRFGTPPRVGIVKMVDWPSPVLWSLMASCVPSKLSTWSLLLRMAKPVSISDGRARGEIELPQPAARGGIVAAGVVDERGAIGQPVGRLEGHARGVVHLVRCPLVTFITSRRLPM